MKISQYQSRIPQYQIINLHQKNKHHLYNNIHLNHVTRNKHIITNNLNNSKKNYMKLFISQIV